MSWCYGLDVPHSLSMAAYVVLCLSFALILSDLCGVPWWYDRRTHPPKIEEGRLQFLSEHIMRCTCRLAYTRLSTIYVAVALSMCRL